MWTNKGERNQLLSLYPLKPFKPFPNYLYVNFCENGQVESIDDSMEFRRQELIRFDPWLRQKEPDIQITETLTSPYLYYSKADSICIEQFFAGRSGFYLFGMCAGETDFEQAYPIYLEILEGFEIYE